VAKYGAEYWRLNKNITKQRAASEGEFFGRIFRGIEVDENWRKCYKKQ
jgi:hypothetical protein